MSIPRLTFLYPSFLSTARGCGTASCCKHAVRTRVGTYPSRAQRCSFTSISRLSNASRPVATQRRCLGTLQSSMTPRRDDAVIVGGVSGGAPPPPPSTAPSAKKASVKTAEGPAKAAKTVEGNGEEKEKSAAKQEPVPTDKPKADKTEIGINYVPESQKDASALDEIMSIKEPESKATPAGKSTGGQGPGSSSNSGKQPTAIPLGPPTEPLISPTLAKQYHNFDTYAMVKQLETGGLTYGQSVVAMKAIRGLLSVNLDKAKESLVTKSISENENYLFRAACSELKTETEFARRTALEKARIDRLQIQHDYEQLEQKLNEDLMNLKDEVSSLFNDRKIVTRQEQRAMEVKIQELNYKLTVLLNGDMRSEIEALRWTTTRRGLIAIAIIAVLVVTLIRYTSVQSHASKKEAEKGIKSEKGKDALHHAADAGLVASLSSSFRDRPDGKDNGDGGTFVSLG
ncbi:hypothetical protein TWF481_005464 [Arthrobotrys musiformis]|uniref:MOZ protein represents a chromatin-associated acetyltransferase n=1 Tax=Arthrobotrys musiformis TaxID=47236 RepID=A0AAV9WFV1_9PEZI